MDKQVYNLQRIQKDGAYQEKDEENINSEE